MSKQREGPTERISYLAAKSRAVVLTELNKRKAWIAACRRDGKPDKDAVEAFNKMAFLANALEEIGTLAYDTPTAEPVNKVMNDALKTIWHRQFFTNKTYGKPDDGRQVLLLVKCDDLTRSPLFWPDTYLPMLDVLAVVYRDRITTDRIECALWCANMQLTKEDLAERHTPRDLSPEHLQHKYEALLKETVNLFFTDLKAPRKAA
jgi:hypothetical protein